MSIVPTLYTFHHSLSFRGAFPRTMAVHALFEISVQLDYSIVPWGKKISKYTFRGKHTVEVGSLHTLRLESLKLIFKP